MKKLTATFALLAFLFAGIANAQTEIKQTTDTKEMKDTKTMYKCSKCGMYSDKAGKCPVHKNDDMVASAKPAKMHQCPKGCMFDKAGKCPVHGEEMKEMKETKETKKMMMEEKKEMPKESPK